MDSEVVGKLSIRLGRLRGLQRWFEGRWRAAMRLPATLASMALLSGLAWAVQGGLSVELNKLEPEEHGCRVYLVITNQGSSSYESFKLDLILFQPDGVIGRRFALDLAPIKPNKRKVTLFDIDNVSCDQVGSFLINDVLECKSDSGPVAECLSQITPSSLAKVQLTK